MGFVAMISIFPPSVTLAQSRDMPVALPSQHLGE